jgi:hypothetical protein
MHDSTVTCSAVHDALFSSSSLSSMYCAVPGTWIGLQMSFTSYLEAVAKLDASFVSAGRPSSYKDEQCEVEASREPVESWLVCCGHSCSRCSTEKLKCEMKSVLKQLKRPSTVNDE